jgi:hypothetical protein
MQIKKVQKAVEKSFFSIVETKSLKFISFKVLDGFWNGWLLYESSSFG